MENEIHEKAPVEKSDTVYTLAYVKYLAGKKNSKAGLIMDSIEGELLQNIIRKFPCIRYYFASLYGIGESAAQSRSKPLKSISYE